MRLRLTLAAALAALSSAVSATPTNIQNTNVWHNTSPTAGCGKSHYWRAISQFHDILTGRRVRRYEVNLPIDYDKNRPYPVVLGFHGSSCIGPCFEADTRMSLRHNSGQRIIVYPSGKAGNWAGANYSDVSVAEDKQFISDMLDEIRAEHCVDDSRIYATGMSNGAGFVNILACDPELSGQFAAFAPHSGAYYNASAEQCNPGRRPVPMLSFHGGKDETVPYDGGEGEGGQLPRIDDWLKEWAERNGCGEGSETSEYTTDKEGVFVRQWKGCNGTEGEVMRHYKLESMGHCWAATTPNFSQLAELQGPTSIGATEIIMKFFDHHQKKL